MWLLLFWAFGVLGDSPVVGFFKMIKVPQDNVVHDETGFAQPFPLGCSLI